MISDCGSCGTLAELDGMWRCGACSAAHSDTEPCPPPSVRPPPLHAAVLAYDGEDWEGAGRAEWEIAVQDMGDE